MPRIKPRSPVKTMHAWGIGPNYNERREHPQDSCRLVKQRVDDLSTSSSSDGFLTRFNKIATQGAPQMAVDKEANSLSRVYSYYSKFNLRLFYV